MTPWSVPSFLSGTYPESEDIAHSTTLQEFLKDRGYETGGIVSNMWDYGTSSRLHRSFEYWDSSPSSCAKSDNSSAVLKSTLAWLSRVKNRRFFLFSLFIDPHSPYIKHEEYDFDPQNDGRMPDKIHLSVLDGKPGTPPPCDLHHMESVYDSDIAFNDERAGRLLNGLKKEGVYDDSLIVLLADHGEEFEDHGALYHIHTLYHELLSVPLVIKLPHQHEGVVVKGCYPLVDLFPSLVAYMHNDPSPLQVQGNPVKLEGLRATRNGCAFSANAEKRSVRTPHTS